ncbi:MAG: hypothetical protein ABSG32_27400 [Terriglobia bacterium]|jgi:hypothetical protein
MNKSARAVSHSQNEMSLRERVKETQATEQAFHSLVKSGCDEEKLAVFLDAVCAWLNDRGHTGPKLFRGYDKDFPRRLAELKTAAHVLETLNQSFLGRIFIERCETNQRECFKSIPALLRGYSGWLERSWKNLPRQFGKSLPVAALMQYVYRATGGWHDSEVADLVALAGDKFAYTVGALKSRRSGWLRKPGFWKEAGAIAQIMAQ